MISHAQSKTTLGISPKGRKISGMGCESSRREPQASYSGDFNA